MLASFEGHAQGRVPLVQPELRHEEVPVAALLAGEIVTMLHKYILPDLYIPEIRDKISIRASFIQILAYLNFFLLKLLFVWFRYSTPSAMGTRWSL